MPLAMVFYYNNREVTNTVHLWAYHFHHVETILVVCKWLSFCRYFYLPSSLGLCLHTYLLPECLWTQWRCSLCYIFSLFSYCCISRFATIFYMHLPCYSPSMNSSYLPPLASVSFHLNSGVSLSCLFFWLITLDWILHCIFSLWVIYTHAFP